MPLREVCASCGREIAGSGFVILDYEELGAFCDQDCGDRRFRSYLYEETEKATS
jgi:DNA-directed RNA polymerase subunit RPC12/RpoP